AGPAADGPGAPRPEPPARKQKRKKKRKREGQKSGDADAPAADGAPATPAKSRPGGAGEAGAPASKSPTLAVRLPEASRMSTLQRQFLERLTSSRFRELNETLYTRPSGDSFDQFTANPELFDQYHEGFRKQAREWPVNPVDVIYGKIVKAWAHRGGGGGPVAVADFGCGDAKLAERLLALRVSKDGRSLAGQPSKRKGRKKGDGPEEAPCPFVVHSFDLVSGGNPLVTPADMSDVPLADGSVDVAVYSLALMGTNVADFVREAWRVLRFGGVLRVAEVRSRFETSSSAPPKRARPNGHGRHSRLKKGRRDGGGAQGGGDGGGDHPLMLLDEFLALLERCGFRSVNMDRTNKMFLFMDFVKEEGSSGLSEKESFTAKPCIYKRSRGSFLLNSTNTIFKRFMPKQPGGVVGGCLRAHRSIQAPPPAAHGGHPGVVAVRPPDPLGPVDEVVRVRVRARQGAVAAHTRPEVDPRRGKAAGLGLGRARPDVGRRRRWGDDRASGTWPMRTSRGCRALGGRRGGRAAPGRGEDAPRPGADVDVILRRLTPVRRDGEACVRVDPSERALRRGHHDVVIRRGEERGLEVDHEAGRHTLQLGLLGLEPGPLEGQLVQHGLDLARLVARAADCVASNVLARRGERLMDGVFLAERVRAVSRDLAALESARKRAWVPIKVLVHLKKCDSTGCRKPLVSGQVWCLKSKPRAGPFAGSRHPPPIKSAQNLEKLTLDELLVVLEPDVPVPPRELHPPPPVHADDLDPVAVLEPDERPLELVLVGPLPAVPAAVRGLPRAPTARDVSPS
ncbi:hypothetical protein THAOC_10072, partial [Thalassiosira oceanica]